MNTLLQVRDLRTHFFTKLGVVKGVDGVSYDLSEGEMIGIVGESGSGKSVSSLSILRLIPYPQARIVSGQVLFQGTDLLQLSEKEMRHIRGNKIAMVFQEPMTSLNPLLTVGRQISETLQIHLGMDKSQAMRRGAELLEMVGIRDGKAKLHDYPHQFSGGMRQRVMIAMALSCNPRLIIADEPTSALDVTTQAQVLEILKGLTQERGIAVILITHSLGLVARYVDRVLVMYAGGIVETAPVRDLYAHPRHPYTIGLLRSVPRLDGAAKQKLVPIEGAPPNLTDRPPGCSFRPRCNQDFHKCSEITPELESVADGHYVSCWLVGDGAR